MRQYHPVWDTIHYVLIIVAVGVVLRFNATAFDETEWNSIVQIALAVAGLVGAKTWVLHKATKGEDADGQQ